MKTIYALTTLAVFYIAAIIGISSYAQVIQQPSPGPVGVCAYNVTPPTLSDGQAGMIQCDATGNARIAGTITSTPSGTQAVNLTQWNGVAASVGNGVAGTGTPRVTIASDSAPFASITPVVTSVAASSLVLKASAGALYGVELTTAGTAGYLLIYNLAAAPADGTVTPIYCKVVAANSSIEMSWGNSPAAFSTGVTAAFSSTGCFTQTLSATAFISGTVK